MPLIDAARMPNSVATFLAEVGPLLEQEFARRLQGDFCRDWSLANVPINTTTAYTDPATTLADACHYATQGGGKRLRPALTLAVCQALGGSREQAMPAAVAIELLHTYTLIHDDLPAMDDDDERRGRPTVHRAYNEATAILAGDALCTEAFVCLSELGDVCGQAVRVLGRAAGLGYLLAGQARDLVYLADPSQVSLQDLYRIHQGKTAALFAAACELGALCARADSHTCLALREFGHALGMSFQFADDIDDGEFPHLQPALREQWQAFGARAHHALVDAKITEGPLPALLQWVSGRF